MVGAEALLEDRDVEIVAADEDDEDGLLAYARERMAP